MKYSLIFTLFLTLNYCYSQSGSVTAYYYEAKGFNHILLLGCNLGYSYSGPHLFIDEVFAYKCTDNKIIRTFDTEYSLRYRLDTLVVNKKSLRNTDGIRLKKVSSRKRDELIKKYIQPSRNVGFYEIFLERLKSCKN